MFCGFCGREITGEEKFCPGCGRELNAEAQGDQGANVNQASSGSSSSFNDNDSNQKVNWKEYLTPENIERYAPVAALLPLAMALVVGVVGGMISNILGIVGIGRVISKILVFLLKAVFCLGTLGATAGLAYIAVKKKNTSDIWTWVAPAATLCAFVSCIGIAFSWGVVAWIFGIVAFVLGLEMFSRITIAGKPMESQVNPGEAFATYKQYYDDYRAKYPTTKDLEREGVIDPENSYFDGNGFELLGYILLAAVVSGITCGIAAPWMICKINQWRLSHTVINGKRLSFNGNGASLLGHWIVWEILTVITCGIYGFFMYVALRKWELNHTYIDGEPVVPNSGVSYFDGNSFEYFGYGLLCGLLLCVTCGLAYPWAMCILQKWDTKHQVVNGRRLAFTGSGIGFLGEYIIIGLLSIITCGIYSPWGIVRMNKYIVSHTDFVD